MKTNKNFIAITATSIISLALLASWVIGYELGSKKIEQNINSENTNTETAAASLYADEEQKYNQSGVITQIEDKTIFIKGQTVKYGELAEETYAVLTDDNTSFKKFNIINNTVEGGEGIKLNDLKEGDNVTAIAAGNIKGITQFKEKQINLYITN